jgi:hypothetical protein
MSLSARVVLWILAVVCGAFFSLVAISFSLAVDPEYFSDSTARLFLLSGMAISCPFWFPVVMPNRLSRFHTRSRWLGGIALVSLAIFFGGMVTRHILQNFDRFGATSSALVLGSVLAFASLAGSVILLWPNLKRK